VHAILLLATLFLPWVSLIYSLNYERIGLSYVPANKCVEVAKLKSERRVVGYSDDFLKALDRSYVLEDYPETERQEPPVEPKPKPKPIKRLIVVGDSLGEGLYLAFYEKFRRKLKCLKVRFFVKHSTTTISWARNRKFLRAVASGKYEGVLIVLGANEFATDSVSLYYNVNKLILKIRKLNPNIEIFWLVPPVPNKNLRKFVEEALGEERTIAIEDFLEEIPLSKDRIHPDIRRGGYRKLWGILLRMWAKEGRLACELSSPQKGKTAERGKPLSLK